MSKIVQFLMVFILLTTVSCETVIPEVDNTPPTFSLEIRGDGFNKTFTQDDAFSRMQLNLKSNTVYSFVYSGSDSGGVGLIQWQLGNNDQMNFIRPEFPVESWTIRSISPSSRMIEWSGDRSNPRTGGILTGDFRTGGSLTGLRTVGLFVSDFGGRSGTPNSVRGDLNILIGDIDTELITF